ncbi:CRP-like cAMP-activated global transcriptional regulator [Sideroxyarcus emersonii]|uniref:CRP-like cAMP-activated global transcriptional regulator n=2 Tax=Sideroxyarcus emersonii TaxID=2764705 RepID=A0AAN1X8E3_9PROT|nr:CRP-like cAMP-activated global transcriptional regulator [Sideroxyarcus emersonii]
MLDIDTTSRLLSQYPMLRELSTADRDALFATANVVNVPAGAIVFDECQPCQGFPLLLSGNIRIIKASANGRELPLYRVSPGDSCILSSSCLLGRANYQARGIAELDTVMVALSPDMFEKLLAVHKPFQDYIFGMFSERLADLMQLLSAVAFQKLDQRLAALLANKPSPFQTTHQALADELGSVREIVSRLLKSFAEKGWIRLEREQIEIVEANSLTEYCSLQ